MAGRKKEGMEEHGKTWNLHGSMRKSEGTWKFCHIRSFKLVLNIIIKKKQHKILTKCAYNEKQMCDNFCALDKSLYYPCGTRFKTDWVIQEE